MSEAFYTDKSRVRAAFERAAPSYDSAAVLQREVSDRMAARLDYIKFSPKVILDAGSGTGYGAAELRRRYPEARVIELDLATTMLQASREKQQAGGGLLGKLFKRAQPWQLCADVECLPLADASVDMIWSNLAIQWVNIPDGVFAEFQRVLKPEGMLMFSTLGPDTLFELRQSFAGVDGATHVNQFIDMHDLGDALLKSGFAEPVMDMDKIVLTYPAGTRRDAGPEGHRRTQRHRRARARPDGQAQLAEGRGGVRTASPGRRLAGYLRSGIRPRLEG